MRFWRLSAEHVCVFSLSHSLTHTRTHHTPLASGLFLFFPAWRILGKEEGAEGGWVQGIPSSHSMLVGGQELAGTPHWSPGKGLRTGALLGKRRREGATGVLAHNPTPCKYWGRSPEGELAAVGSYVGSSDLSSPFHGAHRSKGLGRGHGTGKLGQVSSGSLGLSFAICKMDVLNSMRTGFGGGKGRQIPTG